MLLRNFCSVLGTNGEFKKKKISITANCSAVYCNVLLFVVRVISFVHNNDARSYVM